MLSKRLVLVGAGHAHLYGAARAGDYLKQGIEPVLVDPGSFWYSGMATGMLAGQYPPEGDQVSPDALMRSQGGTFLRDRVVSIDVAHRRVTLASGGELCYDALSLNIGSQVQLSIPGVREHTLPVKPICNLWNLRTRLEKQVASSPASPPQILIIGGGPTGCEVAACCASLARRRGTSATIRILTQGERILSRGPAKISKRMLDVLTRLGVEVETLCTAQQVEEGAVLDATGKYWRGENIVCATGLAAPSLLRESGVPVASDGSLRVLPSLQSLTHPCIFASGDCAALEGFDLPKLGVFGVRQAPVLHHNLLSFLSNTPLKMYQPQKRWLTILNTGDQRAMALYGTFYVYGRIPFLLKNYIDRRFMQSYRKRYES